MPVERTDHEWTVLDPLDYSALDPGVRDVVRYLRARGWVTTDSGDGVTKVDQIASGDAMPVKHVVCKAHVNSVVADAHTLQAVLSEGFPKEKWYVEASYSTRDRKALLIAAVE